VSGNPCADLSIPRIAGLGLGHVKHYVLALKAFVTEIELITKILRGRITEFTSRGLANHHLKQNSWLLFELVMVGIYIYADLQDES
jgi:hypothetical protein